MLSPHVWPSQCQSALTFVLLTLCLGQCVAVYHENGVYPDLGTSIFAKSHPNVKKQYLDGEIKESVLKSISIPITLKEQSLLSSVDRIFLCSCHVWLESLLLLNFFNMYCGLMAKRFGISFIFCLMVTQ